MSKIDINIHSVVHLNTEFSKSSSAGNYIILHAFSDNGEEFEFTFFGVKDKPINITVGDANDVDIKN